VLAVAAQILKALLVSLILAASAYAVAKLNLFGLESSSDRVADGVYQRITAADYGADRKGQSAISVVYLDESSMEAMKGYGWTRFPPTYDQQWTMLDDVMSVGGAPPAAVFVDFVYSGQGGPNEGFDTFINGVAAATKAQVWSGAPGCLVDPLIKIACIEAAGGTPMVFAKPSPADLDVFTDVQRRLDSVAVLAPALVVEQAYPMITDYHFDAPTARRLDVHSFDVSPAMAMYAAWCLRQADSCQIDAFRQLKARAKEALAGRQFRPLDLTRVFDAPLDVVWGSRPDPAYLAMTAAVTGRPAPCRGTGGGWFARLGEQLGGLRGPGAGARQECPYALTLGYDRIVAGLGLQSSDLQRLLAGKMVMVGGQFRASNDWVNSPVQGQAPGVHYHAMALDNLIEDGANYRRSDGVMFDSDLLKSLLIAALAFFGVLGVMVRNSLLDHALATRMEPRLRTVVYAPLYLLLFGASLCAVVAATWLGVSYAHRAPINWIGIAACALAFLFYATRETLPRDILASIEHLPWARRLLAAGGRFRRFLKFEEDRLLAPRPSAPAPPAPAASAPSQTPKARKTRPAKTKDAKEAPANVQS
jgi:CHASE2 domain